MRIWVKGHLGVETVPGGKLFVEFATERVTVRDLLGQLAQGRDESIIAPGRDGRLRILVNGRHVSHLPEGLDTGLKDGDHVAIFPPIAGG